jgi:arabinogalactan oligomer / maltooligosaccharide transport system permease protein
VFPAVGLGTHAGLILVYLGGAIGFNAFLIKGFMDSIPVSLDESARIDGASPWQVFWHIILPLARPVLAVIFIITFIGLYSEFILAQTLLRQVEDYTFAVGLRLFVQSEYAARWGMLAAAAVVGSLPIVVTFLAAQRHIVSGLTQGAVKE